MSVVSDARDEAVADLRKLEPGSDEKLRQAQVVKTLTEADNLDRRLKSVENRQNEFGESIKGDILSKLLIYILKKYELNEIWFKKWIKMDNGKNYIKKI